jgi:ankyrin repeat protein
MVQTKLLEPIPVIMLSGYTFVKNLFLEQDINNEARGKCYGNLIQVASSGGHEQVVKLLLDKGIDINTQSGCRLLSR